MKNPFTFILNLIGSATLMILENVGGVALFFINTVIQIPRRPWEIRNLIKQIEEVGFNSIPVVLITAMFTGMVLCLQSYTGFERFGAETLVGSVVALSMTRELGPVFAGLMVSGRVGAAMAAELGTMRVTEQIDALWTLAANPLKYLVVPRLLAGIIVMPILVVIADVVGIIGGYFVGVKVLGLNATLYLESTFKHLDLEDFYGGLIKSCFFGMIIALLGCYEGYQTSGGAEGVGRATTRAVVSGCIMVLISDYFLTAWLY